MSEDKREPDQDDSLQSRIQETTKEAVDEYRGGTPAPAGDGAAYEFYCWAHDLVVCLTFVTIFFVFAIRLVGVDGPSMTPTLLNGDHVALLSNFFYHDIERGDIIVMRVPSFDKEQPIVKRVIAKAGQTVDIDFTTGTVTVDGEVLDEPYINELTHVSYDVQFPVTVPDGCLFVMGDNRNRSADSRYGPIGMVDERYVLGKVLAIVWPFNRIGTPS